MAILSVNSNLSSMTAARQLDGASKLQARLYERLTTGLRVAHASDDAAGLSIASSLSASSVVFAQGVRNVNDGISLLAIADGAVSELKNILSRIEELATQSANGTLSGKQRISNDTEAQALVKEFNRITAETRFNDVSVFSAQGVELVLSAGGSELAVALGGNQAVGNLSYLAPVRYRGVTNASLDLGDVNRDGILDILSGNPSGGSGGPVFINLGNGNGTFSAGPTLATAAGTTATFTKFSDLNGDGNLDVVVLDTSGAGVITGFLGNGDGSFSKGVVSVHPVGGVYGYEFSMADVNEDGCADMFVNDTAGGLMLGNGDGSFRAGASTAGIGRDAVLEDFDGDGHLDLMSLVAGVSTTLRLGNGNGTFRAPTTVTGAYSVTDRVKSTDLNNDLIPDFVVFVSSTQTSHSWLGNGDGTFRAAESFSTIGGNYYTAPVFGDLNNDGNVDLAVTYAGATDYLSLNVGNGDGTFRAPQTVTQIPGDPSRAAMGDLNGDGVLDLVHNDPWGVAVLLGNSDAEVVSLSAHRFALHDVSLRTLYDARQALGVVQEKREFVQLVSSVLGSSQNRALYAVSVLETLRTETAEAASRIVDADVATEAAALTSTEIRAQAASAVLAQANRQPAIALQLLSG